MKELVIKLITSDLDVVLCKNQIEHTIAQLADLVLLFKHSIIEESIEALDESNEPIEEEARIYVIVPETVQVMQGDTMASIAMEPGRLMAQCAHVVSQMRGEESKLGCNPKVFAPTTTIVLSARNSRELHMLGDALYEAAEEIPAFDGGFGVYRFNDINPVFYGANGEVTTAICTSPVKRSRVDQVIGHLELYA